MVLVQKKDVFSEEISTTHYDNDSFYKDKKISEMDRDKEKQF